MARAWPRGQMRWSRQMRHWLQERLVSGVVPGVNQLITSSDRSDPDPMVGIELVAGATYGQVLVIGYLDDD